MSPRYKWRASVLLVLALLVGVLGPGLTPTALAATGAGVVQWGENSGNTPSVVGLSDVKAISAGGAHRLVLKNDGTAWVSLGGELGGPPAAGVPGQQRLFAVVRWKNNALYERHRQTP